MGTALLTKQGRQIPVEVPEEGITVDALLTQVDELAATGQDAMVVVSGSQGTKMGTGQTVVRPGDQVTVVDQVRAG